MRGNDPVTPAGPHKWNLTDLLAGTRTVGRERVTQHAISEDAREVVDPTVAFGLPDDGDNLISLKCSVLEALHEAPGVGN